MSVLSALKATLALETELQTVGILRHRFALAKEQLAVAERRVTALELEHARLVDENHELKRCLIIELQKGPLK